jgi:hypothetical protein
MKRERTPEAGKVPVPDEIRKAVCAMPRSTAMIAFGIGKPTYYALCAAGGLVAQSVIDRIRENL